MNNDNSKCHPQPPTPPIQTETPPPKRPPTTSSSLPPELREPNPRAPIHRRRARTGHVEHAPRNQAAMKKNDTVERTIRGLGHLARKKSRVAYEVCVALYRHCTFRHGDLVGDLGEPSPPLKDCMKSRHPRAERRQQRQGRQFTNGAFLANISICISLDCERDGGASYVLYQLFRCQRLRNLFVELKMSASAVGTYDGDGRKWASPLSEIAHMCEGLQKAAGERLRLVVYVDEAFWGEHVLDEFDRRGVSWSMGVEERRGPESLGNEWSQRMTLTTDVRLRQDQDPKQHLKI